MARRHGKHARSGRGTDAGRLIAHEEQRLNWQERNASRDFYIHELDSKVVHLTDKGKRAKKIKTGWAIANGRVAGLDDWVIAYNKVAAPKARTMTLSIDQIGRRLPIRR